MNLAKRTHEEILKAPESRLALFEIAAPALNQMSSGQRAQFYEILKLLVSKEVQLSFKTFFLVKFLKRSLGFETTSSGAAPKEKEVREALLVILSALLWADPKLTREVFSRMLANARISLAAPLEPESLSPARLDESLNVIERASLKVRELTVELAIQLIQANQQITVEEAELVRTLALCLQIPIPPGFQDVLQAKSLSMPHQEAS